MQKQIHKQHTRTREVVEVESNHDVDQQIREVAERLGKLGVETEAAVDEIDVQLWEFEQTA